MTLFLEISGEPKICNLANNNQCQYFMTIAQLGEKIFSSRSSCSGPTAGSDDLGCCIYAILSSVHGGHHSGPNQLAVQFLWNNQQWANSDVCRCKL